MIENWPDEFIGAKEAGRYARINAMSVHLALKKKKLKGIKKKVKDKRGRLKYCWIIKRVDIDEYRLLKYNREKRVVDGEKLFDIEHDRWSVLHASKAISIVLGRPYPPRRIIDLLGNGYIRGTKKCGMWIIGRQEIQMVIDKEMGSSKQLLLDIK